MANITGTLGNDTLTGTANSDQILGLAGDDLILAGDGNDGTREQVKLAEQINYLTKGTI